MLSLYIHIPYCLRRCGYCDFNTYTPSELALTDGIPSISRSYCDLLIEEMAHYSLIGPISTIFFGGGTPSLMEPSDIARILNSAEKRFGFTDDIEITLEANPDTVDLEKLVAFRATGINRISIGMQSALPHVLATLDRTHKPENVERAVLAAHEAGFTEISLDLIYGTPGESMDDWKTSLESALALPITHLSAYALILEEGTKLNAMVRRGEVTMPDDDETADKYLIIDEYVSRKGMHWYELSNWSLPGSECRHNLAYWHNQNWLGLGPGAHSHIDGKRFWNVKHPNTYRMRLEAQSLPVENSEIVNAQEREEERLLLGIRLPGGIARESISDSVAPHLESYLNSGALDPDAWRSGRISLTPTGRLIADRIVREMSL
jgi:putative oxygen-independent coproporphyrinogen III oxidase